MTKRILSYLLLVYIAGIALSSCKVTQPYQAPQANTDKLFRDIATSDTSSMANLPWREVFTDASLQILIQKGIENNPNLLSAYTRIQQAQAYYLQSRAALLPSLNASATASPQVFKSKNGQNFSQYQLGLSSGWEADIWGKLQSSKKANLAALLQTEAAAKAIQTGLVASIANYYYQLLALDQQLLITEQTVKNWDSTVITMKALKIAAVVTEAAVVQSEAQRYGAAVTIPDLKQQIKETENALSILTGSVPSGITRRSLQDQQITASLETGVPVLLLANRPDVQQAELNFRQLFELGNVAKAYFYPTLSITAAAGFNSQSLSNLFNPGSFLASIGAGLTQPIFNQRANRTRLEVANAQKQEALLNFQNTLLTAGKEVSDAMSSYKTALDKITVRNYQTDALQKSVDYSQELLENGFANYTEVITARQSLLQAQLASINDRLQQLSAVVNLYRALGGGWN